MADKRKKSNSSRQKPRAGAARGSAKQKSILSLYRKEIWGVFLLLLALLIVFCSLDKQSAVAKLFMGLVGQTGIYILPVGLVLCFITLCFHGGRPVTMRLVCAISFSLLIAAVSHLALVGDVRGTWNGIDGLYVSGKAAQSGGVLGGLLAKLFSLIAGNPGAWVICIILLVIVLPASLNLTLTGLLRAINNHREKHPKEEKEYVEPAEKLVEHVAQRRAERAEQTVERQSQSERRSQPTAADTRHPKRFAYNLPVDEPPIPMSEPAPKQVDREGPISPDEFIKQKRQQNQGAAAVPEAAPKTDFTASPLPSPEPPAVPVPPIENPLAKVKPEETRQSAAEVAMEIASKQDEPKEEYQYPPVELLREGRKTAVDVTAEMRDNTARLKETLDCFNIDAQIINVTRGPSVTMYELELAQGVRLNRLTGLAVDIALALGAASVRISAIPDKISMVGIEVPNKLVSVVTAREVIDSPAFRNAKEKLSFAVGKDISGNCIIGDIPKLPHMLIAGTTGSGKSVCMNSLIISLLYKATPEEVRLIMVDPKMVELGVYNGIPHLLIPVVTDPRKASGALQWTVVEMLRRYRMMSEAEVRDIDSYNNQAKNLGDRKPLEQIVVVIDELADLMLVAEKEVEESICRIAQMGRAAGIHLIIATQRPSTDVITGLMKANIPSRIAFAVSSAMESRIILDASGAEKLIGKGDMFFSPLGIGKPKRVQGCFICEEEVQSVIDFIKKHSDPNYSQDVQAQIDLKAEQSGKGGSPVPMTASETAVPEQSGDELLPAAVEVILDTKQASVSMLQRRLKLGYARAARIVDEMEERGIVGPFEGSKPRQLLITREQWDAMQSGDTDEPAESDNPPVEEEIP